MRWNEEGNVNKLSFTVYSCGQMAKQIRVASNVFGGIETDDWVDAIFLHAPSSDAA